MWEFGITKIGIQSKRRSAKNVLCSDSSECQRRKWKKIKFAITKLRIQWKCPKNVLWSESFRNVKKENGKKNQGKLRITKLRNTEKRFAVRESFQNVNGKSGKKSWKIPNHKAQKSEKKTNRMAAFCSESFPNLFGENGKKINFSLTGDLIDLSAFTVGKFFEIIFTLRP